MICTREGCEREARWAPRISVPPAGGGGRSVDVIIGLPVCTPCVEQLTAADFIAEGDPARELIRARLSMMAAGRFLLGWGLARLDRVSLTSPEVARLLPPGAGS